MLPLAQLRGDGLPSHCPHPRAGTGPATLLRAGGIYLYWEHWESIMKLSITQWPPGRGSCSLPSQRLTLLFTSHSTGQAASAFGEGAYLPVLPVLTKSLGAWENYKPVAKRQKRVLKEPAGREQPWALISHDSTAVGTRPRSITDTLPPN